MASPSSPLPPAELHHMQDDDDAVLTSLLLDLWRGYDDEQEQKVEQDEEATAIEYAPARRAYRRLASEYYTQQPSRNDPNCKLTRRVRKEFWPRYLTPVG